MRSLISYHLMKTGEEEEVFSLVDRGFGQYVRADFSQEGIDEFHRAAKSMIFDHPCGHFIKVAKANGKIVGMIDMRDGFHISLFFVDSQYQNQGIGRGLLDSAISVYRRRNPYLKEIEVHSSLWAVPVYEKLGFRQTKPMQEENGIRFVAMVKELGRSL